MNKCLLALLLAVSTAAVAGNCDSYYGTAADGSECGLRSHDSRVAPSQQQAPQAQGGNTNTTACFSANEDWSVNGDKAMGLTVNPQNKEVMLTDGVKGNTYFYAGVKEYDGMHYQLYSTMQEGDAPTNEHLEMMLIFSPQNKQTFNIMFHKVADSKALSDWSRFTCSFS
ncbi:MULTISPECIES: hypothetical protein [unclassified Enterobacter cloacae complex]|uniref:hypothetical protein n=1 Tax=Enterobacter cloacae complex TaxID=354276 RepID=UPI001D049EEE|nr:MULTISPECIES: hypothetical protein [unclassified Enterobacter cloacae complex]